MQKPTKPKTKLRRGISKARRAIGSEKAAQAQAREKGPKPLELGGKTFWKVWGAIQIIDLSKKKRRSIQFSTLHAITIAGTVTQAAVREALVADVIATHKACKHPYFAPRYTCNLPGGSTASTSMVEIWGINQLAARKYRNLTEAKRKPLVTISAEQLTQLPLPGISDEPERCNHGLDLNEPCQKCTDEFNAANGPLVTMDYVCVHGRSNASVCLECDLEGWQSDPRNPINGGEGMPEIAPPLRPETLPSPTPSPEIKAPASPMPLRKPAEELRDCPSGCGVSGWVMSKPGDLVAVECPYCNRSTKSFGQRAVAIHAWNEGETTAS